MFVSLAFDVGPEFLVAFVRKDDVVDVTVVLVAASALSCFLDFFIFSFGFCSFLFLVFCEEAFFSF